MLIVIEYLNDFSVSASVLAIIEFYLITQHLLITVPKYLIVNFDLNLFWGQ